MGWTASCGADGAAAPWAPEGMRRFCAVLLAALWWPLALWAQQVQTVRIAFIDPLSGPAADIGRNRLKSWRFVAERLNAA